MAPGRLGYGWVMTEHAGENQPGCVTGHQFALSRGDAKVVVTELGAGLRLYSRSGIDLTETYADTDIAPLAAGLPLAPWPNRIAGGRWKLHNAVQQLDITEVRRGNAMHGLLRNAGYHLLEREEHDVYLAAMVFPQHGYPFRVEHRVRYTIDENSDLQITQELINHSAQPAPFALGAHPYLRIGDAPPEDLTLTVSGTQRLVTDDKLIPTGAEPVSGLLDLRNGACVADLDMDSAYTGLHFSKDGRTSHTLRDRIGRSVTLWAEEAFPYAHIFVTSRYPGRSKAVAIEPMTAPANAFNSGEGLRWLEPGEFFRGRWGITADLKPKEGSQ